MLALRIFLVTLSLWLVSGCAKAPTPTAMSVVKDEADKLSFKGPSGWTEGREAKSFTLREPSGMSILTVTSLPKGAMGLESLFTQSWNGLGALIGSPGTKPAPVKIGAFSGLQAHADGKLEGHPCTVMMTIVEAPDRFVSFQGILTDRDEATRLKILSDSAESLELTP